MKTTYMHTTVGIPRRSWRYGYRCEIRIHVVGVNPLGRGYRDRCYAVWGDFDSRHDGPRSAYGQALARADELCAALNAGGGAAS